MDFDEHQQDSRNKVLEATAGLWNAILTVNGIILAVFGALYTATPVGNSHYVEFIVVACVISCCLMVFNHFAMKASLSQISKFMDAEKLQTPEEERRDSEIHLRRHRAIQISESAALVLFIAEVLCVAIFVFSHPAH
jgi:Na+/melibiose symporter-like transporter